MIVVMGGGIIGLSLGWQLLRNGLCVHLLEAHEVGRQASWVAAGMLAPHVEARLGHPCLSDNGLAYYPEFLAELAADSGVNVPFETCGSLLLSNGKETRFSEDAQVNNRVLLKALRSAFLNRGGVLTENQPVANVLVERSRVRGVRLQNGDALAAQIVVNCCGAWAASVAPLPTPVRPQKGEILTVRRPEGLPFSHIFCSADVYLVPKDDGTLRIGATCVDTGFEAKVTAKGAFGLLHEALRLCPDLRESEIVEMSAGLRPMTSSHQPLIGSTSILGYFQACGHGRRGILLAPLTAYTLTKEILCASAVMAKALL